MKLSGFFSEFFEALTINPTNFLRPPFNSQFFLSFKLFFGHKTPGGLKT